MANQKVEQAFRQEYRELKPMEAQRVARIKSTAAQLANMYCPTDTPELQLAFRKLEESVMWAVKSITQ